MIDARTGCVAIFGNPVNHSLSPQMHNAAFKHLDLNMVYLAFRVIQVTDIATAMRTLGLRGASITVPHKEAIVGHLDEIDEISQAIGAVNTVSNLEGRLLGYNTDWLGVVRAFEHVTELEGKCCLVLGSGGAARAAIHGLQRSGVKVLLMNRNEVRGRRLATEMNCTFSHWQSWTALEADLVINATPVGMSPHIDRSVVPPQWFRPGMVVMDMVYRPQKTRFLRDAEAAGCAGISGLEMLLYQGAAQLEIWTGREAPVKIMRRALMDAFGNEANQNS
ncbi:MAG: shikimate dehydrogenase [Deltaproteobacteria bacterium]|nr:MAG: shikimate dehydrogenase [Deltaproteobacteria bacterium]